MIYYEIVEIETTNDIWVEIYRDPDKSKAVAWAEGLFNSKPSNLMNLRVRKENESHIHHKYTGLVGSKTYEEAKRKLERMRKPTDSGAES